MQQMLSIEDSANLYEMLSPKLTQSEQEALRTLCSAFSAALEESDLLWKAVCRAKGRVWDDKSVGDILGAAISEIEVRRGVVTGGTFA